MNDHLTANERTLIQAAEYLWCVVANVSGGDWEKQTHEWQSAAAKARDDFHAIATSLNAKVS